MFNSSCVGDQGTDQTYSDRGGWKCNDLWWRGAGESRAVFDENEQYQKE